MIKLPSDTKQYSIPNSSDLVGNIWYSKNCTFDEEGYIKLSHRAVSIQNEIDTSNIGLATAFGRKNAVNSVVPATEFTMVQNRTKAHWFRLSELRLSADIDVGIGVATLTADSHGCWFQNLWHVTDDTKLYSKSDIGDSQTYTERATGLNSGKVHCLETFGNRSTICVGNGSAVNQYDTSYSASTHLAISSGYEVVGMAYSNNLMGIVTMTSDTASGQNQDARFFTWDGSTTTPYQSVPVGSDKVIALVPYQGSWILLTRTGELKYWTGGGFKTLAAFPFYYKQLLWGQSYNRELLGNVMQVDGDVVYINMNGILNASGDKYDLYLQNNPGGIWCYDPKVGLYQKFSPSISSANILTVTSGNIDTSTNILTKTAGTIPSTGSPIKYTYDRGSQIGGLTTPTIYYCIKLSSTTFKLAETYDDATAGTAVDITSTGAANNYFMALEVYDFGQSITNKSGAIGLFDVDSQTYEQMIFGVELNDATTTGNSYHVNLLCSGFESRGYFVTPKIISNNAEDVLQKLYTSHNPLKTGDSIIYKIKDEELEALPVSTLQARTTAQNNCTWSTNRIFTTSVDLSDVLSYFTAGKELECEIIGGAGAGCLAKVQNIYLQSTTYIVELAEDIPGAASGRYCDALFDNWTEIGTITSTSNTTKNLSTVSSTSKSSWVKIKCEMRGRDVALFDQKLINKAHKKAE